ncbi:MAG: hypothetical protein MJ136_01640 [Clostridia bacterium]|nr:hypothetical protein [Clostridia bacterium]
MPPSACLGLPLAQALLVCKKAGQEPEVRMTGMEDRGETTMRVIGLRPGVLVAAHFRDGDPRRKDNE